MSRPTFDTHGVASHALNRRSGTTVAIEQRVPGEPRDATTADYLISWPDGFHEVAFGTELRFVGPRMTAWAEEVQPRPHSVWDDLYGTATASALRCAWPRTQHPAPACLYHDLGIEARGCTCP